MLKTLYTDELRGYLKSRVLLVLFVGLPLLAVLLHYFRPDTEGMPLSQLVAILISSIGGTLAAVVLSTSITAERGRHVYDMFLVRPVRRWALLLAKFLGMLSCLLATALLSMLLALLVDGLRLGLSPSVLLRGLVDPLLTAVAGMAVACAIGVLFGILFSSVAVAAILSVYLGNQLAGLIILPTVLVPGFRTVPYLLGVGIVVPALLLVLSVLLFERKSL